jgi:hypothetical protein
MDAVSRKLPTTVTFPHIRAKAAMVESMHDYALPVSVIKVQTENKKV